MTRTVTLSAGEFALDGEPRVLLCASLFPFRLPEEQWADRIAGVVRLGYHVLDVIVPWNFHELAPGEFDFTGRRDIDRFFDLVEQTDLLVMVRPGPYMCAEYDAGGYPAWLGTVPGLRLRQNEPLHLAQVQRWFDQVLPIIARHQITRGGCIALVQLENELDFSPCDDPAGYIAALKQMADAHGIDVPTITCAGEGDLQRSNGDVAGVGAAVNLYPDDVAAPIEATAAHYAAAVAERDLPLILTETNRLHRTIKRMIIAGARFVGPYLQASAWNFDSTMSTNSWGQPYAFMASDYDFGGVIAPDGTERAGAADARRLRATLDALGTRLARAVALHDPAAGVRTTDAATVAYGVQLHGGGRLYGVTHLGADPARIGLRTSDGEIEVTVPAGDCVFLPVDLPLRGLGVESTLVCSSAEIVGLATVDGEIALTVHTDDLDARLVLTTPTRATVDGDLAVTQTDTRVHLTGRAGRARIALAEGGVVRVQVISTADAGALPPTAPAAAPRLPDVAVTQVRRSADIVEWGHTPTPIRPAADAPLHLEHHGIYRGAGIYRTPAPAGAARGVVLRGAADILGVHLPGSMPRQIVGAGQDVFVDLGDVDVPTGADLVVTAEIWGHSNFDDERLPALGLGSLRGIAGGGVVTAIDDLTYGWTLHSAGGARYIGTPAPLSSWGGWSSSERPQRVEYARRLRRADGELLALRIVDTQTVHEVRIDGTPVGAITPLSPVLDLTPHVPAGAAVDLTVVAARTFNEQFGRASLLRGVAADEWQLGAVTTSALVRGATASARNAAGFDLPLEVAPGTARWVHLDLTDPAVAPLLAARSALARFDADNARLTVVHHGHVIARIWSHEPEGVQVRGGRGDIALIVQEWVASSPTLSILVEPIDPRPARLDRVVISHRIDPDPPAAA